MTETRPTRGALLLTWALAAPLLVVYSFLLVERKYAVLLGRQTFLLAESMNAWESTLYVIFFPAEIAGLLLTAATMILKILPKRRRLDVFVMAAIAFIWFVVVTFQFRVLRYFADGLDLAVARKLGGNDLGAAMAYVKDELVGLLPLVIGTLVGFVVALILLKRYGSRFSRRIEDSAAIARLTSAKSLFRINLALFLFPLLAALTMPVLHHALSRSLAHQVYSAPWEYLSDVDFDGYGLMSRPIDHAPFDSSRHPYAVEIVDNDIDENGVGGDLEKITWTAPARPDWTSSALEHKNIVLVVLESARADLIDADHDGQPVMPFLRSLPGSRFRLISHVAFTSPSIVATFKGVMSQEVEATSLIESLRDIGYRTGVFSGQHERFGDKAELAGMTLADHFTDASTEDPDSRMYPSTAPASLKIPAAIMTTRFLEWLDEGSDAPFFAYVNWQELHFPYHYDGAPNPLGIDPLPRSEITEDNRPRLVATYHGAARIVDDNLRVLVDALKQRGAFADTLLLVIGDHGEELFEYGSLGHGTSLGFAQNAALGKLIGSDWEVSDHPHAISEVPTILFNALCRQSEARLAISNRVFGYVGSMTTPSQIGYFTPTGLIKYDFLKDAWLHQERAGRPFEAAEPDLSLIHDWESWVLEHRPEAP